jgi:hypothetical protein
MRASCLGSCGQPRENSHALTAAKMTPMISHVRVCGCAAPPPRAMRANARMRKRTESAARIYFAATATHFSSARSRCCLHAGALVLKSGVPGFRRQR